MSDLMDIDFNGVDASFGRELLASGDYMLIVNAAQVKATKAGTGSYVSAEFEVISGESKGRRLWHNFNVKNPSETAERIGKAELKALAEACGISGQLADSGQLNGKVITGSIDTETGKDGVKRNRLKKVAPAGAGVQVPAHKLTDSDNIPF